MVDLMHKSSPTKSESAKLTCLLLLLLLPSLAKAERLPLKAYTVADGLAHNAVNKIVRDSRGFPLVLHRRGAVAL